MAAAPHQHGADYCWGPSEPGRQYDTTHHHKDVHYHLEEWILAQGAPHLIGLVVEVGGTSKPGECLYTVHHCPPRKTTPPT